MLRSPQVSCGFEMQTELSLQSRAHLADLIFQNCSERESFFNMLKCKSSSRYSPVHFLSTTFPDRSQQQKNHRPYFGDPWSHIIKKHRVSRPIMFSPVNSRAPELFITSLLLRHANCSSSLFSWHDEKTSPASSSIIRKFSNLTSFDHSYATFNDRWSYSCHSYQKTSRSQTGLFGRGTRSQQPTRWCRWSTCPCSSRLLPCNASSASKRPALMGFGGQPSRSVHNWLVKKRAPSSWMMIIRLNLG